MLKQPYKVFDLENSHAVPFKAKRLVFSSKKEPAGQLVVCKSGEIQVLGFDGEWVVPSGYMIYIPADRMFRIQIEKPSSGVVIKLCRNEVSWAHNGCWVGPTSDLAVHLSNYALKWSSETARKRKQARAFFVTLGEMLPGWFKQDRIMWVPYAKNPSIQKVIDIARLKGATINLPEVAAHVGMSERTLRRYMHAELGQSWREFIREIRMNKAMELLRNERKSVTETAFEVGFSSSSAFSSAFLGYVGRTPSAFAKSFRIRADDSSSLREL